MAQNFWPSQKFPPCRSLPCAPSQEIQVQRPTNLPIFSPWFSILNRTLHSAHFTSAAPTVKAESHCFRPPQATVFATHAGATRFPTPPTAPRVIRSHCPEHRHLCQTSKPAHVRFPLFSQWAQPTQQSTCTDWCNLADRPSRRCGTPVATRPGLNGQQHPSAPPPLPQILYWHPSPCFPQPPARSPFDEQKRKEKFTWSFLLTASAPKSAAGWRAGCRSSAASGTWSAARPSPPARAGIVPPPP